jgi:hypothetical protein
VRAAYEAPAELAHHVDIGVAHFRAPLDLGWLDWFVGRLDISRYERFMHIEAIAWSALAMRMGGGYLDPHHWVCWRNSQVKRLRRMLGTSGVAMLSREPLGQAKCFHAGGVAKWWLGDAVAEGIFADPQPTPAQTNPLPLVALPRRRFELEQNFKRLLRMSGYYHVMNRNRR